MSYDPISCGNRIRKIRQQHHLTQEQVAADLHVFHKHLSKIETGKSSGSVELLANIAEYFHVSTDYLLFGKVDPRHNAKKQFDIAIDFLQAMKEAL